MYRFWIYFAVSVPMGSAYANPASDTWMSVLLDGRKVGYMHNTRSVRDNHVFSTQSMNLALERSGIKLGLISEESSEETLAGEPIEFSARSQLSGIETVIKGHLRGDGQMDITTNIAGVNQNRTVPWPAGALLAEGLRLSALKPSLTPGTRFTDLAFETSSLSAIRVTSTVGAQAWVDLPQGRKQLQLIEQDLAIPGSEMHTRSWIDRDQTVYKMVMPVMGFTLTMMACSKTCALAPNQSTDLFEHTLVKAPRALAPDELHHGLKFDLLPNDSASPLTITSTDEQTSKALGSGHIELDIAPITGLEKETHGTKPEPADFHATDWLQSDAPELQTLAKQAVADATEPLDQMQHIEKFVRSYISNKNLSVGYASALEVARTREGDCTEHAVLVAALGRARGIATRVVDGLAYTNRYAGMDHVFVPHAWAQAWIGHHWQSFDAALPGFDAGHIALSVGDGDPWRFYAGLNTLGNLRLIKIESLQTSARSNE